MDLISLMPEMLEDACSMGKVISRSTSNEPSVGETVMT